MKVEALRELYTYDPEVGQLYRNGPAFFRHTVLEGRKYTYQQICFAIHHGYLPPYVCSWDGNLKNNAISNLYDPAAHFTSGSELQAYAKNGKYPGVYAASGPGCKNGRTYQGRCRSGRTAVSRTPEIAFALLLLLKAQVEWEQSQKETEQ